MLRFIGPLALTLGKKLNPGPLEKRCETNGNEGIRAWALGKENGDTRVIAKRRKSLGKTAFQHPCTAGGWLGKKKRRLGVARNPCKNVGKPMVSAGPAPCARGSERIPFSPSVGTLGLSENLENPWKNHQFRRRAQTINPASASDLLRLALGSDAWAEKSETRNLAQTVRPS